MILTIRTDNPQAELGLFDGLNQLAYLTWEAHRALAETIHTELDKLLSKQKLSLPDLTGIICYEGPGSFTGLRIGLSVGNALGYGLGIPVVAAGGRNWIKLGHALLTKSAKTSLALPHYGAPVHITQPKTRAS